MSRPPEFVTFTGFDDWTSIDGMRELSNRYPVEWGILFSLTRQGTDPRYPGIRGILGLERAAGLRLSAHLCGRYAARVMDGYGDPELPMHLSHFRRAQINTTFPIISRAEAFAERWALSTILQCRDGVAFPPALDHHPKLGGVLWLQDASGGSGAPPSDWLPYPGHPVGYAGGLGPDNVRDAVEKIDAGGPYWLDMESGVRTDDRLDLSKCRAVCEAIWPERKA